MHIWYRFLCFIRSWNWWLKTIRPWTQYFCEMSRYSIPFSCSWFGVFIYEMGSREDSRLHLISCAQVKHIYLGQYFVDVLVITYLFFLHNSINIPLCKKRCWFCLLTLGNLRSEPPRAGNFPQLCLPECHETSLAWLWSLILLNSSTFS